MNIALPNKSTISSFLRWFVTWSMYCIIGIIYLGYPIKGASALGYQVVISKETVERVASYKADLTDGKTIAGKYLGERISGLDLSNISTCEFIELLLSTKKPWIFAEQDVKCDGTDWSSREFAILGDINVAVKALAYDNGV